MKDGKPVFHKSFNPELYLYNFCNVDLKEIVYITTDIFRCIYSIENGRQCVCNFGLPYLSSAQLELLRPADKISFLVDRELIRPMMIQMVENEMNFCKFEKE
jgi:hypothetical protein